MEQIATNAVLAEDDPMENASAKQDQKDVAAAAVAVPLVGANAAKAVALVNAPVHVVPFKCA